MKFYYAGFNMYGQITNATDHVISSFNQYYDEDLEVIDLSHFCAIFQYKNNNKFLCGAANSKTKQKIKLKIPENATQILLSDDRILLLDGNGKVFKIALDNLQDVKELPNFIHKECEDATDKIIKMACNTSMNIFLTEHQKLFNLSTLLNFNAKDIIDLCVGIEHCLILDKLGNIYSFGQGSRGQLGHGTLENETNPIQIEALAGITISKISAGGWHSCVISKDGDLYSWGWNSNGQLGIESNVGVMATPHLVDVEGDKEVVNVACGNKHTVLLLDDNRLFGMGWNKYKQLGNEPQVENNYRPIFIGQFQEGVNNLKCGTWSTVVY